MNLYAIKEGALNETSGISFNIYISGCKGYCHGCHSDHTWDFNSGSLLVVEELVEYISYIHSYKFDHICILGGEPLDHPTEEIVRLIKALQKFKKPIWLYTHFELEEVPEEVLSELDYVKTGEFVLGLPEAPEQHGVFLVGENQKIHKLK